MVIFPSVLNASRINFSVGISFFFLKDSDEKRVRERGMLMNVLCICCAVFPLAQ